VLTATVRELSDSDWPMVAALEAATYRPLGLSEDPAMLRSRAGSGTSFVVALGGTVAGYLLALPYPYGRCPDLTAFDAAGDAPDLHLHDLNVAAGHRGTGLGSRLVEHLLTAARERAYARVSLVSLQGTGAFWTRHGFSPRPEVPAPTGYGLGATYLSRSL
jgi:GNAT superfamily N-acetyltransferase